MIARRMTPHNTNYDDLEDHCIINRLRNNQPAIFLAGSMTPWRDEFVSEMSDFRSYHNQGFSFVDPTNPDWDNTWAEDPENEKFRNQVRWESTGLRSCDYVFFNFAGGTESPASIAEFGYALAVVGPIRTYAVIPKDFWKWGYLRTLFSVTTEGLIDRQIFDTVEEGISFLKRLANQTEL